MQYHENFNLKGIVTLVKADLFASMLSDAGYDNDKITFLHQGFTRGFDLCYEGPKQRQSRSQNIPFMVGN